MHKSAKWLGAVLLLSACGSDAASFVVPLGPGESDSTEPRAIHFSDGKTPEGYKPGVPKDFVLATNFEGKFKVEQPRDWPDGVALRATSIAIHDMPYGKMFVGVKNFGVLKVCANIFGLSMFDADGKILFDGDEALDGRLYQKKKGGGLVSCLEPGAESVVQLDVFKLDTSKIALISIGAEDGWDGPVSDADLEPFPTPTLESLEGSLLWDEQTLLTGRMKSGERGMSMLWATFYARDQDGFFRDADNFQKLNVDASAEFPLDGCAFPKVSPEDVHDVVVNYEGSAAK